MFLKNLSSTERFKDIALAASNLIQQWNGTANATTQETTLREISHNLCSLKQICPSLLLHWCHVLQLLGFQDHNWWRNLYGFIGVSNGEQRKENWTGEITRKGVLLLYASLLEECYEVSVNLVLCYFWTCPRQPACRLYRELSSPFRSSPLTVEAARRLAHAGFRHFQFFS